jgi:protein-disulfide isomerase
MSSHDTITISKSTVKIAAFVFVAFILGFAIGNVFTITPTAKVVVPDSGSDNQPSQPAAQPSQQAPSGDGVRMADILDDDPARGDPNAPVVMVEWSDFQCPFCGRFYGETLPQIEENYIKTGKLKIVYRDFPLSFHPEAQPAAEAAECANEQGKFWEFHDLIFSNQQSMSAGAYKQWAADLGLNTQQFNDCFDSGKYTSEIQKDFNEGAAIGISGTPGFYLGRADGTGVRIVGAQPYSVFSSAIDQMLAG